MADILPFCGIRYAAAGGDLAAAAASITQPILSALRHLGVTLLQSLVFFYLLSGLILRDLGSDRALEAA